MSVKTTLFPPPLKHSDLPEPIQKWLFTLQNLSPLIVGQDGDVETLPPAGLNEATGQSNQNAEYSYVVAGGAGSVTINGAFGGPVTITSSQVARFKSNGTIWVRLI